MSKKLGKKNLKSKDSYKWFVLLETEEENDLCHKDLFAFNSYDLALRRYSSIKFMIQCESITSFIDVLLLDQSGKVLMQHTEEDSRYITCASFEDLQIGRTTIKLNMGDDKPPYEIISRSVRGLGSGVWGRSATPG